MKNELFIPNAASTEVYRITQTAYVFFMLMLEEKGLRTTPLVIVKTTDGFDIEYNGIEIGSYGRREANGYSWVYGTGLAEPRFSSVIV